jgi:hypothetical protein
MYPQNGFGCAIKFWGPPPRRMRRDRGFASWLEGVSAKLQHVFAAVWFVLHELMLPRPHSLEHA